MAAANASVPVTAQSGGAATLDGVQHFLLGPGQPGATAFDEALALGANDIGHLEGGPISFFVPLPRLVDSFGTGHIHRVQRIGHGLQVPPREVQVKGRVPKVDVTEQQLNRAQVGAFL